MADKVTPIGTEALPDNPELENLKIREKVLSDKVKALDGMNLNLASKPGHDLQESKRRTAEQLAEVRKEIQRLEK